jgi:hypothetical protein
VYLLTVRDLLVTLLLFDGQLLLLQGELLQELEENRPHLCDRMLCQIPGKSINDSEDGPVQFSLNKCVFLIFGADLYDQVSDHVIVRGKWTGMTLENVCLLFFLDEFWVALDPKAGGGLPVVKFGLIWRELAFLVEEDRLQRVSPKVVRAVWRQSTDDQLD